MRARVYCGIFLIGLSLIISVAAVYKAWGYRSEAIRFQQLFAAATNDSGRDLDAEVWRRQSNDLSVARILEQTSVEPQKQFAIDQKSVAQPPVRAFAVKVIRRDAGLPFNGKYTDREASIAVRDFVYRSMNPSADLLPYDTSSTHYAALGSNLNYMFCGGAAASYAWALNALGIRARAVQLAGPKFLSGEDFYQTHVTVEAWLDGKWEVSDPTFNVAISCSTDSAKHLSVPEAVVCLKNGNTLVYSRGRSRGLRDRPDAVALPEYFAAYTLPASDDEQPQFYPTADWLVRAAALYK